MFLLKQSVLRTLVPKRTPRFSKRTAHNFILVSKVLKRPPWGGGEFRFGHKHCFHFESNLQNLITHIYVVNDDIIIRSGHAVSVTS